eukprot:SAG31_NODE_18034_length_649_cov_0.752727_1_plen_30_part_01
MQTDHLVVVVAASHLKCKRLLDRGGVSFHI